MRRLVSSWTRTLAQLGFVRRTKKRKDRRENTKPFTRPLRIETLENRVVLSANSLSLVQAELELLPGQFIQDHTTVDIETGISTIDPTGLGIEVATNEWIVQFSENAPATKPGREAIFDSFSAAYSYDTLDSQAFGILRNLDASWEALDAFAQSHSDILTIEPNYTYTVNATPNDSAYSGMWGLNNTGQDYLDWDPTTLQFTTVANSAGITDVDIDAPEAWNTTTGSTDVVVGVLDTGIDYTHPDLYLNVWINQDEIPSSFMSSLVDVDSDSLITFHDLNDPLNWNSGNTFIQDLNSNGYIDAGDLLGKTSLTDPTIDTQTVWEDGGNPDGNGKTDDLIGWDFANNDNDPWDDDFHGTHVSGTIGASGNNGTGVVGVNWNVQIMPLKFLASGGTGFLGDAKNALDYSRDLKVNGGANLVATNNSYRGGYSSTLETAIANHNAEGILFVASAGNGGPDRIGDNTDVYPQFPASYTLDNVISVAATDISDQLGQFSNFGSVSVDLGAPGVNTLSTFPTIDTPGMDALLLQGIDLSTNYEVISGTSMAAPHVAGTIALLSAADPNATALELKDSILLGVDNTAALQGKVLTSGRLNAADSLAALSVNGPLLESVVLPEGPEIVPYGDNYTASTSFLDELTFTFTQDLLNTSIVNSNLSLLKSGGDGTFGDGNEVVVDLSSAILSQPQGDQIHLALPTELAELETYKLTFVATGTNPLRSTTGNAIYDGTDYEYLFEISTVSATGEISVSTLTDEFDGDYSSGDLSLREALYLASQTTEEIVSFAVTGSIAMNSSLGRLEVDSNLTIDGPATSLLTVDAQGSSEAFYVSSGVNATIQGMTIRGGNSLLGGGILINGDLTLDSTLVTNNSATEGGGIYVDSGGSLQLLNSEVSTNQATGATGRGGGIRSLGQLTLDNTIVSGNTSTGIGGGISIAEDSPATILNSQVSTNTAAGAGGGLSGVLTGDLTIRDTTISDNSSTAARGGAIWFLSDEGDLNLESSVITGNSADGQGGGIYIATNNIYHQLGDPIPVIDVNILQSQISNNNTSSTGGGLHITSGANTDLQVSISESTVADNSSASFGGGILVRNATTTLNVERSTVSGNSTGTFGRGGGVFAQSSADVSFVNSTISGNTTPLTSGGVYLYNAGTTSFISSTITANQAGTGGGGITVVGNLPTLHNTILAENTSSSGATDLNGSINSASSHNLFGFGTVVPIGLGNIVLTSGQSAGLSALADNEGPTQTHTILSGSPALDSGNNAQATGLATEQRGFDRIDNLNNVVDIGAVESYPELVVSTIVDEYDGDFSAGDLSLREAITISSSYPASAAIITFASNITGEMLLIAQLTITDDVEIQGPGSEVLSLNGQGQDRVLDITGSSSVTIQGLTITGGSATQGGGIRSEGPLTLESSVVTANTSSGSGGGIYLVEGSSIEISNSVISNNTAAGAGGGMRAVLTGDLNIRDTTFSGNSSTAARGGAIWFIGDEGDLNLESSVITGNTANGEGGGIYIATNNLYHQLGDPIPVTDVNILQSQISNNESSSSGGGLYITPGSDTDLQVSISDSNITDNYSTSLGGGLYVRKGNTTVNVERSTISGNSTGPSGRGGGVFARSGANLNFVNSTISGNTASITSGGVYLFNAGTTSFTNSTITANQAGTGGGGISVVGNAPVLNNTILAENSSTSGAADLNGIIDSTSSYNLLGNGVSAPAGQGNIVLAGGQSAGLAPLGNYGGPTETHVLLSGSPAIDAGSDSEATGLATDQRGLSRFVGTVDIGAVETERLYFLVSTTVDELDGDHSAGDLSLREAVQLANAATGPATILLPSGRYVLSRTGTEQGDATYYDLDITGDVTIVGDGAGASVIEAGFASIPGNSHWLRIFTVANSATLDLQKATLTGADSFTALAFGGAIKADPGSTLTVTDSAFVNNVDTSNGIGLGIASEGADTTILRSVFTGNHGRGATSVYAYASGSGAGSLTIGDSLFALNTSAFGAPNVYVFGAVSLQNLGGNLYDDATGGFFDTTSGVGDHLGFVDYVVTSVLDTFDHSDDFEALSIREASDLANQASGTKEVWIPAWDFTLTRDRVTYGGGSATDTDVAFGDLDIAGPLTVRGIAGKTNVAWKPGIVDDVFDLLGDYNNTGETDNADYTVWSDTQGSGSGTSADWEVFAADGDDDGDVDQDDYNLWNQYFGNTLDLFDVTL